MGINSLSDQASNQKPLTQLELRDKLYDTLQQTAALAAVAHSQAFLVFDKAIQRNYLWVLEDFTLTALETYSALDICLDKQRTL